MNNTYHLRLFGAISVIKDGQPLRGFESRKSLALLGYLARQSHPIARSQLADLFWGDRSEARGRRNLSHDLSQLSALLPGAFEADYHSIRCTLAATACVDTARFEALAASRPAASGPPRAGRDSLAARDIADETDAWFLDNAIAELNATALSEAIGLYGGEFMAGLYLDGCPEFETWLLREREFWQRQVTETLERLVAHHALRHEDEQALAFARRWLELERWQEDAHRYLMILLARGGKRGAALAQYETCRRILAEELSVEPEQSTAELYEQIRAGRLERRPRAQVSRAVGIPEARCIEQQPRRSPAQYTHPRWGEPPTIGRLYDRRTELATLRGWLVDEHCQLIAVVGMGGVGKTALAASLAEWAADRFDRVIWRSLLNAPQPDEVLRDCIQTLAGPRLVAVPDSLDQQLDLLIEELCQQRCLLILDNLESIFLGGERAGVYRPGYEGYGQLINCVGQHRHQSCLILTGREPPLELARLERDTPLARSYQLRGLTAAGGQAILGEQGLTDQTNDHVTLSERYSGNPLALRLVAATIRDLFAGDIVAFLRTETPIFDDIRDVLDQQFARLSPLEREILLWLAIEREAVTVEIIQHDLLRPESQRAVLEAIRSLQRRSLLEWHANAFTIQNVIVEYLTDRLVAQAGSEIETGTLDWLTHHALLKAQAKEYVRQSQARLILQPVAEWLAARLGRQGLLEKLRSILGALREREPLVLSYAAGNILNVLMYLGYDLRGFDFSRLAIRQAFLRGVALPETNFTGADLSSSVFTDAFGEVHSVAFSPDGKLLAAGTSDGAILWWELADSRLIGSTTGHTSFVWSVAFSPDGRLLASAGEDHTVRLWDAHTGQPIHVLYGHTQWVKSVAWRSDSSLIASASGDGTLRVWDAHDGQPIRVVSTSDSALRAVAFSADGTRLVSGGDDGAVRVWDARTGQALATLPGHSGWVRSVACSPDGLVVASAGNDQTIRMWDACSGRVKLVIRQHNNTVTSIMFSQDSRQLVSASSDQTVRLWDARTGLPIHCLYGHTSWIHTATFSSDGALLASAGQDQTVRLWDARTGLPIRWLHGYLCWVEAVAFSSDGALLASAGQGQTVRLWDARTGRLLHTLYGHTSWVRAVALDHGGMVLASAGGDQTVRLWDAQTGCPLRTLYGHTSWIRSAAFSPNGALLATGAQDQTVRLWDFQIGRIIYVLRGHADGVDALAFSPDGLILASGSYDQTVWLWDVLTGRVLHVLHGHTGWVEAVAFSSDGATLASAGGDRTIRLWEVGGGRIRRVLRGHTSTVASVVFSPDDRLLASAGYDREIRVWDVRTGRTLHVLRGHTSWVRSVAFSSDGAVIRSGSNDETVKFWSTQRGDCVGTVRFDRPYARMNITGATGLTEAQRTALRSLGALEDTDNAPSDSEIQFVAAHR